MNNKNRDVQKVSVTFPNGNKYHGNIRNNQLHYGTLTFPNGNKYHGEFKNNHFDGRGTFHFADGDSFHGTFKDDNMHGVFLCILNHFIGSVNPFVATEADKIDGKWITIECYNNDKEVASVLLSRSCNKQILDNEFRKFGVYEKMARQM